MKIKKFKKTEMSLGNYRHEEQLLAVKLVIDPRKNDCPRAIKLASSAKTDKEKANICIECPLDEYPDCWLAVHGDRL